MGDVYEDGASGNFSDPIWIDDSTTPPEHDSGPPGAGDTALIDGGPEATMTASGGTVKILEGTSNFSVSGAFTATTLEFNGALMGAGTLTATTVSGVSPALQLIEGGNLVATTMGRDFDVEGGSLMVNTYSGQNATVSNGGTATLSNPQKNLNVSLSSGGQLTCATLSGSFGSVEIDGANSQLTVKGQMYQRAASLDLTNGGEATVGLDLGIDGASIGPGQIVGGGGMCSGTGSTLNAQGIFAVGVSEGSSAFGINSGGTVIANLLNVAEAKAATGYISLSDSGSSIQVAKGLDIGAEGFGTINVTNDAGIQLGNGAAVAVGFDKGSYGVLTLDGTGTIMDTRLGTFGAGISSGAHGTVTLTNGAALLIDGQGYAGRGGYGWVEADSGSQIIIANQADSPSAGPDGFVVGGQKAGKGDYGALNIQSPGGELSASEPITVARDPGSSGGIGVTGTFISDHDLTIGKSGAGTVNMAAGGQMLLSGSLAQVEFGKEKGSSGIVALQDPGTEIYLNQVQSLVVGDEGKGELNITGGASVIYNSATATSIAYGEEPTGHLAFGFVQGGEGDLTVDGTGSLFSTSSTCGIGYIGKGIWKITNGGTVLTPSVTVAPAKGSYGSILVDGTGSSWVVTDILDLGLTARVFGFGDDGVASVTVSNGATMRVGTTLEMTNLATVTVSGGQVLVGPASESFGPPGSLRIGNGGFVTCLGKIYATVIVASGGHFNPGADPGPLIVNGGLQAESWRGPEHRSGRKQAGNL